MTSSIWALLPPLLAIAVSLKTKEVNLSLMAGIFIGAMLYTGFDLFSAIITILDIISSKLSENASIIVFIFLLGMIVHLMNLSGASSRYAQWASRKLKTKKQTLLATMALGVLIFVDDYFNCLTVGTVMRPITDRYKVSREKLAYVIDSTAAPICVIAPLSTWAAAISSSLPVNSQIDGFGLFTRAIICNYYSWFALAMVLFSILLDVDFGKMRSYELLAGKKEASDFQKKTTDSSPGKAVDLLLPVIALIVFSLVSMLYTGGLFSGQATGINEAFANCDAITGMALGTVFTTAFLAILYLPRRIVTFRQFADGIITGTQNMVSGALILLLAWTLGGICSDTYLNTGGYVAEMVEKHNVQLSLMPAIFFVIALILAFSTGTSWGTFGILLPIAANVFENQTSSLMIVTTAAILGGSVCGDHLSPISDTTILSSTGAECDHIAHVKSQMPYGLIAASITFFVYLIPGISDRKMIGLFGGVTMILFFLIIVKVHNQKRQGITEH